MKPFAVRTPSLYTIVSAVSLWLIAAAPVHASTVTPGPLDLQTGVPYSWKVVMGGDFDLAHYHGDVGAKSWAEPLNPVGAKGWTHTSDWTALDHTGMSGPTILTLELGRVDPPTPSELFPAFTLFSGWQADAPSGVNHTWNNTGNPSWTPSLTYIDHQANAGGPNGTDSGTGEGTLSRSWVLTPGLYTLNYGGNPSFDLGQTGLHGFAATLATQPVPVPAAVYLFGSGLIGLAGLARRKFSA